MTPATNPARRNRFAVALFSFLLLTAACGTAVGSGVGLGSPGDAARCATDGTDCADPNSVDPGGVDPGGVVPGSVVDTVVDPSAADCPPEGCTGWTDVPVVDSAEGTPRPVAWESAVTDPTSTDVTVRWWSGVEPCYALQRVAVVETETTVSVTVFEASVHADDAEVACIEIAQAKQFTVTLSAPLGDREIVDGS